MSSMRHAADSIGTIVLAAGASVRLGQPKQLLPYRGRTLLRHALETASAAKLGPVCLVTGALHEELLGEAADLPVQVVRNADWAIGMGASIQTGITALETDFHHLQGVLIMLCDQPLVTPELLRELALQTQQTSCPVAAAAYAGGPGVPALFARRLFPLLHALPPANGARRLLQSLPNEITLVPFPDGEVDVDTPAQYEQLLRRTGSLH